MLTPRWYQEEAIQALFHFFSAMRDGNPLIAHPTGTGKSIVIGGFLQRALSFYPNTRAMMLTHVKELIGQNARKIVEMWPGAPLGIYSAGLGQKVTNMPLIYGGVASVVNNVEAFGHIDLLLIDEAHLLSPNADSRYQQIIAKLRAVNPFLRVVGFSATIYRMGQGLLTEGGLFTHVAHDLCSLEMFNRLIREGVISPLIPKRPRTQIDTSDVSMQNSDFNLSQLQAVADKDEITFGALREMCEYGWDRKKWLIFASGVDHAEHVNVALQSFGVSSTVVHSRLSDEDRDARIEGFKNGQFQAIVNNQILTIGFDHPPIDLMGVLRPTMSTPLWVQMLGRGTRPSEGKENCLVMDFANNTPRLGPINDPVIPKARKPGQKREQGDAPVRVCESCGTYNHSSASICAGCGATFTHSVKIWKEAGTEELIRSDFPEVHWFEVDRVLYNRHHKEGGYPQIKVSYVCGLRMFNEWVSLEHPGFPSKKARDWWRQRHWNEAPETTDEALKLLAELRTPTQIRVWVNKKYPEVLGAAF
jgi:DNA repair protein RadD